jgi:hypothetical protein
MKRVSTPALVHAGNYALLTKKGSDKGTSSCLHRFKAPITTGDLYLRAYLYLDTDPVPDTPGTNFVVILELTAPTGDPDPDRNKTGFDLGPKGVVFLHCPWDGWINVPGTKLAQQKWTCVELRVSMDTGAAWLRINGMQVQSCPADPSKLPAGGYASATFGITSWHPARVLYDDVVVSRASVGCH